MRFLVRAPLVRALYAAVFATAFAAGGQAQTFTSPPAASRPLATTPVQGWWEEDHATDRARDAYWKLPRPALDRYNRLQTEINQLTAQRQQIDDQIRHAQQQQRELLGFTRR